MFGNLFKVIKKKWRKKRQKRKAVGWECKQILYSILRQRARFARSWKKVGGKQCKW